jgi:hypothetical protein
VQRSYSGKEDEIQQQQSVQLDREDHSKKGKSRLTSIIFTIIVDHQHHFPLVNGISNQSTANPRDIFSRLHLFKLALEEIG